MLHSRLQNVVFGHLLAGLLQKLYNLPSLRSSFLGLRSHGMPLVVARSGHRPSFGHSPSRLSPTRRTAATSYGYGAGVKTPLPLGRTYRKSRPRVLGAVLLATLWDSPRPSQRILAALRRLLSALLTRGCAGPWS